MKKLTQKQLLYVVYSLTNAIDEQVKPKTYKEVKAAVEAGMYYFIPLSPDLFVKTMAGVLQMYRSLHAERVNFLDVGCGHGSKMLLMRSLMLAMECYGNVSGIEYDKKYVKASERLYMANHIWLGDALTYKEYGEYNIIYFYCPFRDREKQRKLEQLIAKQASNGTILVEMLKQNDSMMNEDGVHLISSDSYGDNKILYKGEESTAVWLREKFGGILPS